MMNGKQPLDPATVLPLIAGEGWRGFVRRGLDVLLGLPAIREGFNRAAAGGAHFFDRVCGEFGLVPDMGAAAFQLDGPLLVVANHPFGGADAMVLAALCLRARPDVLILANEMVAELPGIGEFVLPLSILGAEDSARRNGAALRRALAHLKSGGALAAFPSGEVAHWRGTGVQEGPWSPHVAALAQRTRARVVPVRFFGHNPPWFHLLGALHPLARTALLPRVLLASRGQRIKCRTGPWIDAADHAARTAADFAAWLRRETLAIAPD